MKASSLWNQLYEAKISFQKLAQKTKAFPVKGMANIVSY